MARKAAHCVKRPSTPRSCLFDFSARTPLYGLRDMNTPDSRIYVGRFERDRPVVYAVDAAGAEPLRAIDWRNDAVELARVLLADASGAEPPADVCGRFAERIVSRIPRDGFALPSETVSAWLRRTVSV